MSNETETNAAVDAMERLLVSMHSVVRWTNKIISIEARHNGNLDRLRNGPGGGYGFRHELFRHIRIESKKLRIVADTIEKMDKGLPVEPICKEGD